MAPAPDTEVSEDKCERLSMSDIARAVRELASRLDRIEGLISAAATQYPTTNQLSGYSISDAATSYNRDWKLQDIGFFAPKSSKKSDESEIVDIYTDTGVIVIYRDIRVWKQIVADMITTPERQELFRHEGWTLLHAEASEWWHYQLGDTERSAARLTVDAFLSALTNRFAIKPYEASQWLLQNTYTMEMNKDNENVRNFAMKLFKHARIWGDSTDSQLLQRLYRALHPRLQERVNRPREGTPISEYLEFLDKMQQSIYQEMKKDAKGASFLATEGKDETYWSSPRRSESSFRSRSLVFPRSSQGSQESRDYYQPSSYTRHEGRGKFPSTVQPQWRNPDRHSQHRAGQRRQDKSYLGRPQRRYWKYGKRGKRGDHTIADEVVLYENDPNFESKMRRLEDDDYVVLGDGYEFLDEFEERDEY